MNALAREKSPYLLQHKNNPVDWRAWSEETFALARKENRPIFLSIGYSTCHWCHVMERESFEDAETARLLNAHFVSIKVDREERPDVDKIYITAAQAMTGQGGWPLNCFLTPALKPFYCGTYFPPEPMHGRPSFRQVLAQIAKVWENRQNLALKTSDELVGQLGAALTWPAPPPSRGLDAAWLGRAAELFKREYDPQWGGFGGAPKFPRPSQPIFLLNQAVKHRDNEAKEMVLNTCDRMAAGGIHDQLGGGFARYSVDAQWLVPHFEKMLYDNAQLAHLYLDAFLASGQARHAEVARGILNYILRDMTHPEGGFYSAEDADSEGKEGKFYCWTKAELKALLAPDEFAVVVRYFGVTDAGNFVDHSDPNPLPYQNVLCVADPRLTDAERAKLDAAKAKMFAARGKRVRPHLDDKTLASWNGMMLGAMARAAAVLGDETFRAAAEKNLAFLQAKLWDAGAATLYHRWRDGERDSVQLLTAYAEMAAGALDLYQATLQPRHLEFAIALADAMIARFYDPKDGGFYSSAAGAGDLILRIKEDYDGAEPSGNSVATLALLKLAAITGRADYRSAAEKTLRLFGERLGSVPQAAPFLLQALDFYLTEPKRVVIASDPGRAETAALIRAAHAAYQPNKIVLGNAGPVEPFARTLAEKDGPSVYVCSGTACQPPTRDAAQIAQALAG